MEYDKRNRNAIKPVVLSFAALKLEFEIRYPYFFNFPWFEKELHDLWMMGPPDLNDKSGNPKADQGRRMLLPNQVHKFAREIAQRIGQEIMQRAGSH